MTWYVSAEHQPPVPFDTQTDADTLAGRYHPVVWELPDQEEESA